MQVDVSGSRFENPDMCACCGGTAETKMPVVARREVGKRVVRTEANSYTFPYCSSCVEHVEAANVALKTAVYIFCVSLPGAGYFYFLSATSNFAKFVIISGGAGSAIAYFGLMARAKSFCAPACTSVYCTVDYIGWGGYIQKFEIGSHSYAQAFRVLNQKKLVNVSIEDWQRLQDDFLEKPPSKPESISRSKR